MSATITLDQPAAYFDRLADVEACHWWARAMWRISSRWLDVALRGRSGLDALDVGCGTGMTALRLARRPEVGHVVGLDPCPEALDHARLRHEFPLVLGSALELPFGDRTFDLVTCFDVLQHLPPGGDRTALAEVCRVLRPGGVAVVRSNAAPAFGDRSRGGYLLRELAALFAATGLEVRRSSYVNALPALAQEFVGLVARRPGHPSGGGLRIEVPPPRRNRLMGLVGTAEALVVGAGGRLPFGHGTMLWGTKIA